MPTHYCCCFAVRHAVIFMSMVLLFASSFLSSITWWIVGHGNHVRTPNLSNEVKSAYIATGVFSSSLILIALTGLAGAIGRNVPLISIYYCGLWVSLLAMTALGVYHLDIIIRNIDSNAVPRVMYAVAFVIIFIFIFVGAIVAYRFGTELWEDAHDKRQSRSSSAALNPETREKRRPLLRIEIPQSTYTRNSSFP